VTKLVACDLDGTLLDDLRRIPEPNRRAVAAVRARGVAFVLCTGRPPRAVRPFWEDLGLSEPVVAYNGALIWDMAAQMPRWEAAIGPELLAEAIRCARADVPDAVLSVEAMDHWWTDRILPRRPDAGFQSPPDAEGPVESLTSGRAAHKLLFRAEAEPFARLLGDLPAGLHATRNRDGLVEVQAERAAKSLAVAHLALADDVLAIGDDANDLDLLRWAGDSAAPANATAEARAAARRTVRDNNAGALADALAALLAPA
jgi:Cof subfamily protein (haloacid dehalogenase superfamily)